MIDSFEDSRWTSLLGKFFVENFLTRVLLIGRANKHFYLGKRIWYIWGLDFEEWWQIPCRVLCMHVYAYFELMYVLRMMQYFGLTPLLRYAMHDLVGTSVFVTFWLSDSLGSWYVPGTGHDTLDNREYTIWFFVKEETFVLVWPLIYEPHVFLENRC